MNGKFLANYEKFPDNDKKSFHLTNANRSGQMNNLPHSDYLSRDK